MVRSLFWLNTVLYQVDLAWIVIKLLNATLFHGHEFSVLSVRNPGRIQIGIANKKQRSVDSSWKRAASELRTEQNASTLMDEHSKQLSDLFDKGVWKQNLATLADVPASDGCD